MSFASMACSECGLGRHIEVIGQLEIQSSADDGDPISHPYALIYCRNCEKYTLWATAPARKNRNTSQIIYSAQPPAEYLEMLLERAESIARVLRALCKPYLVDDLVTR